MGKLNLGEFESLSEAVRAAKNGDKAGFSYIYESTYREKYYIALKYVKNEADAEDVLADAYVKAWERIDSLADADKVSAWLGQIVARTALDALKKKKPLLFTTEEEERGVILEIEDDHLEVQPEVSLTTKERQAIIREMIDTLSDEQRLCVLMRYFEEMTVAEIAQILECPEGTVMSRLSYARKKLKDKAEALQKEGYSFYCVAPVSLLVQLMAVDMAESASVIGLTGAAAGFLGAGGVAGASDGGAAAGFFGTLAGRITLGVAGVAVVAGLAVGGRYIADRVGASDEEVAVTSTPGEDSSGQEAVPDRDTGIGDEENTGREQTEESVSDGDIPQLVDGGLKKNELEAVLACVPEDFDGRTLTKREVSQVIINGTFFYEDKTIPGSGQRTMKIEDANRLLSAITDYRFGDKASSVPLVRVVRDELYLGNIDGAADKDALGWGNSGYQGRKVTIDRIVKKGSELLVTYEREGVREKKIVEEDGWYWETGETIYTQSLEATMTLTDGGKYRVKKVQALSKIRRA